jgi:hypothetical protein
VEVLRPPAFRGLPTSRVASCGSHQTLPRRESRFRHFPCACGQIEESEVQSASAAFSPM